MKPGVILKCNSLFITILGVIPEHLLSGLVQTMLINLSK